MPLSNPVWRNVRLNKEWRDKIAAIEPIIVAAEAEAIQNRCFPLTAVNVMREAGLFQLGITKEVGGFEVDAIMEMEIIEAVAKISVSAAWNLVVGNIHTGWASAFLSDEAIAEIFPEGHATVVAGQASPTGIGVAVDGGYRVSGKYSWGSGYNHATWVMGGFTVDGGPPMIFVAPKSKAICLDNWNVFGIEGSGSYDFAVEDVFIPHGYYYTFMFAETKRGGDRYSLPFIIQSLAPHVAVSLGGAQHALDCVARLAATKRRGLSTSILAERGAFQRDLAEAYTRISAARALLIQAIEQYHSVSEWTPEEIARFVSIGAWASALAVDVATMAFRYGGGNSVRLDSPLQRILRDVSVAQQHVAIGDQVYEQFGLAMIDASLGA
jgi:indole-3-acetate monooxygenase